MTATEFVTLLVQVVFVALALDKLIDFLRHRDRARLDIVLMVGSLAVTILTPVIGPALKLSQAWVGLISGLPLIAQPYLLLRLVRHFRPVPAWLRWAGLAGMLLIPFGIFGLPEEARLIPGLLFLVYFIGLESYSAVAFVRGARAARGMLRWRMTWAAIGSGLLAGAFVVAGLLGLVPALRPFSGVATLFVTLLSAISFYLGFATPRPLRHSWQLAELYRFLRQTSARPLADQSTVMLHDLCVAATRAVGGRATTVWQWDAATGQLQLQASDQSGAPAAVPSDPSEALVKVARTHQPVLANTPTEMGTEGARLAAGLEAVSLIAVPLARLGHTWGVLAVFIAHHSLFPDDDVNMLSLLADQAAETLGRAALLEEQGRLLKQVTSVNQELASTTASLETIVDNIPVMLFVKDAQDLRFTHWNRAGEEIVGLSRATVLGKNDYDFFPTAEADAFTAKDREVLAGGVLIDIPEEPIQTPHRGARLLHTRKVPLMGADGRPSALLGISEDITERKAAEQKIQQLSEELVQRAALLEVANQELEAFSYSVSHDLRAPLRGIAGFSQALLEDYADKIDEDGQDYLRRMQAASKRMAELIDDMLNLSHVSRSEMRRGRVDLTGLAQVIRRELEQADPQRQVTWTIGEQLDVQGDARLLRIALENLLGNAWKFTSKQPAAHIEVGRQTDEAGPFYYVRDNGAGFDMAYADKLFGVFQRLHAAADFSGTGIGLATVQRVIRRHGGQVWAEGAVNQGATFYFRL